MYDFEAHLQRQIAFSRATFGPGDRTDGVIDHIKKELEEITQEPANTRHTEWVDVVILALDGLWRSLENHSYAAHKLTPFAPDYESRTDYIAYMMTRLINEKQNKNELRDWPDWRTADPNKAIEHVRGNHD